jgi:hypothetical protein
MSSAPGESGQHHHRANGVDRPCDLMIVQREAGQLQDALPVVSLDFGACPASEQDQLERARVIDVDASATGGRSSSSARAG